MSGDEIKHLMNFILEQQAIFSSDMIEIKNRLDQMSLKDEEQREAIQAHREVLQTHSAMIQAHSEMLQTHSEMIQAQRDTARMQSESIKAQSENIIRLSENVGELKTVLHHFIETTQMSFQQLSREGEVNRRELREAMEKLIAGNEATRELANKAGQLAIGVSQRLTTHERDKHS